MTFLQVPKCLKMLVDEKGINLLVKNNLNKTPLTIAMIFGNKPAVKYLIQKGGKALTNNEHADEMK